jgi:hypothetical protein
VGRLRPAGRRRGRTLLTPRIPDLEGVRLDVLDDTKWNANRLLRKIAAGLPTARRTGRAPEFRREALMQRDVFGPADLVRVIDHPLSTLRDAKERSARGSGRTAMSADLAWGMTAEGARLLLTQCHIPFI